MKGTGLGEEYENKNSHRLANEEQLCCDENTPCVSNVSNDDNNSNNKMIIDAINYNNANVLHRGKNPHNKKTEEDDRLDVGYQKSDLKSRIQEELEKSHREQLILLKEYKQNIIDFIIENKDSIRIEDLKIYEPIYKCYRQKGHCHICNSLSNIVCVSCNNYNNKEVWLCSGHWQEHSIDNHP